VILLALWSDDLELMSVVRRWTFSARWIREERQAMSEQKEEREVGRKKKPASLCSVCGDWDPATVSDPLSQCCPTRPPYMWKYERRCRQRETTCGI